MFADEPFVGSDFKDQVNSEMFVSRASAIASQQNCLPCPRKRYASGSSDRSADASHLKVMRFGLRWAVGGFEPVRSQICRVLAQSQKRQIYSIPPSYFSGSSASPLSTASLLVAHSFALRAVGLSKPIPRIRRIEAILLGFKTTSTFGCERKRSSENN